jgi:uronate dehydrogenase
MKRVVITGSNGLIGSILLRGLTGFQLIPVDLPCDLTIFKNVQKVLKNAYAVVHLAWDTKTENYESKDINPLNNQMSFNIYKACHTLGVKKIIMASSVHTDQFNQSDKDLDPYRLPTPDSPYGASKVFMESLGRYFAKKGLEVVCLRFSCINEQDRPNINCEYLSHRDCQNLVQKILDADPIPHNYQIIYAVSNKRIHSTKNIFGWKPLDVNI